MKKLLSLLLAGGLTLGSTSIAHASETHLPSQDFTISFETTNEQQTRLFGATSIFIGGILVGFVIDGVFIYSTGYSGGELAANLIANIIAAVTGSRSIDGTSYEVFVT